MSAGRDARRVAADFEPVVPDLKAAMKWQEMKKIKKKKAAFAQPMVPAFLVGWTHDDPPPPGFLSSWFDREYGGPLTIRFWESSGHYRFDACHTVWTVRVDLSPTSEQVSQWQASLQWEHSHIACLGFPSLGGQDRADRVLHLARLARGVCLLTGGTTFDCSTGTYMNPSDWRNCGLTGFVVEDHVKVEQQIRTGEERLWLHTRGLTKFGWDELEAFRGVGLTTEDCQRRLLETAAAIIRENRNVNVGEQIDLPGAFCRASVIRYRTDACYGRPIAYREIGWDTCGETGL